MYSEYRNIDIEKKLSIARFRPLDIMVTGVTGAGKSTTLNSFFKKEVAKVGTGVDPETMELDSYTLNDLVRFWDTPGLGDGVEIDRIHSKKIVDLLYKTYILDDTTYGWIDLVLVIIEGANRDMGTTYNLLNNVIVPNFQRDRILVVINQADVAMKGRHWDNKRNKPDSVLEKFLDWKSIGAFTSMQIYAQNKDICYLILSGTIILLFSISISLFPILCTKPKKILAEMEG